MRDKSTVVFRKFLNDSTSSFVALTTNEYEANEWKDRSVDLKIDDGNDCANFYYSFNSQRDDHHGTTYDDAQYEQAVKELEALRFAVTSAIEEVATAYMNTREDVEVVKDEDQPDMFDEAEVQE